MGEAAVEAEAVDAAAVRVGGEHDEADTDVDDSGRE